MRSLFRLALVVVVAALGVTGTVVAIAPHFASYTRAVQIEAGDVPDLAPLARGSKMFDAAGNQIDELFVENVQPFRLTDVPRDVIEAVLAVEDAGFYEHRGVDAKGLLRAGLANVSVGGTTQGGSTITQQLVKNALVGSKRDANRKILEASYAVALEKRLSKDQILEAYLNRIYLGNNAYGLQAAALTYFGKDVQQLGLLDGAFLAGLIRNPVGYDPIYRAERSRARFKDALLRLVKVGRITEEAAKGIGESWALPDHLQSPTKVQTARTYFSAEVRKFLLNNSTILGADYQQRYNALFRGGLKVITTWDPAIQAAAEQARADQLPDTAGRIEAAVVTLQNDTGAVRAMIGGPGFDTTQVNLATTPRQTGSAIKGFILAAGIAAGLQPDDQINGINDKTCQFWHTPPDKLDPYKQDSDETHDGQGRLDQMTWNSVNCAFIRMYFSVGGPRVLATAHRMGVKGKLQDQFSFATGGNEVSALDMAAGYSTLANEGVQRDPYMVERIEDAEGRVVYQHEVVNNQALERGAALRTVDILKGVIRQGTATRAKLADDRPAAGKTGTYEADKHAWFVGFTKQFTTAVYVGNPNTPEPMQNIPEFSQPPLPGQQAFTKVFGGSYPALIWKELTETIHANLEAQDWEAPPPLVRKPARVYAPGQDCYGVVVGDDETGKSVVPGKTPTTPAADPADAAAPAAVAAVFQQFYNCHYGGFVLSPPKTTTTVEGDPGAAGADDATVTGTPTSTRPRPATTKKP